MATRKEKEARFELEERALKFTTKFMKDSRDHFANYFERFIHQVELYLNNRDEWKKKKLRADLKPPTVFRQIESFAPQMVAAIWNYAEDSVAVKPWIPNPTEQDVEDGRNLTKWVTMKLDKAQFVPNLTVFVKDLLLHGTAIMKSPWLKKRKNIIERRTEIDAVTQEPYLVKEEITKVVYNNIQIDPIKLIDFFPSPRAYKPADIDAMDGCVHRFWRTYDQLKKMRKVTSKDGKSRGVYINLDELKVEVKAGDTDAWKNASKVGTSDSDHTRYDTAIGRNLTSKHQGQIEIWEYWGIFDWRDGKGPKETLITVANGDVIIRLQKNPYDEQFRPFLACVDYPVQGEFYGIGEIEPVESSMAESTTLRNIRLDQAQQSAYRMLMVEKTAGVNPRSLYWRPSGIVLTSNNEGIKPLPISETNVSSQQEINSIELEIQNTTANIDPSQRSAGMGQAFSRTAKGVQYFENFTANRLGLKLMLMEELFIEPLCEMLMKHAKQFMTEDEAVPVGGKEQFEMAVIKPVLFEKEWMLQKGGLMRQAQKPLRQSNLESIGTFILELEKANPGTFKPIALAKRYLRERDWDDIETLLNTPEDQAQIQAMQQMQENQGMLPPSGDEIPVDAMMAEQGIVKPEMGGE
jgi:hypothetical protein